MKQNKGHNDQENENTSFGTNKQNIYKVPDNYFNELNVNLEAKIAEEEVLIQDLKKKNIYKTPDQYFEKLPEIIDSKLNLVSKDPKIIAFKNFNVVTLLKMAASIALILSLGYTGYYIVNSNQNNTAELTNNSYYNFSISEYETGLFDETEDELIVSLDFNNSISEKELLFDYFTLEDPELTLDEIDEYLDSDIELNIEF